MKLKISKDDNLAELAAKHPEVAEILAEEYGLHCIGCFAAEFDTLEEGAGLHGYDEEEVQEMVERLNKIINKGKK